VLAALVVALPCTVVSDGHAAPVTGASDQRVAFFDSPA
jgi:hypothetical protein